MKRWWRDYKLALPLLFTTIIYSCGQYYWERENTLITTYFANLVILCMDKILYNKSTLIYATPIIMGYPIIFSSMLFPGSYQNSLAWRVYSILTTALFQVIFHVVWMLKNQVSYDEVLLVKETNIINGDDCSICLEKINKGLVFKCGHIYHKKCIDTHIELNNSKCPLCRRDLIV